MYEVRGDYLRLPSDEEAALITAARDSEPVRGLTHEFYKYPARFSPVFARVAIETFTRSGDLVLDPHVGGGTTLVEALATGRKAIGVDISTLAEFVTRVKCTVFSEAELDTLEEWAKTVPGCIHPRWPSTPFTVYRDLGYYKHLDHPSRWRLRKSIEQSISSAILLSKPRLVSFGRCAVLRTAQWALDSRKKQPAVEEFRAILEKTAESMVHGARELRAAVLANGRHPVTFARRNAAGIEKCPRLRAMRKPRLVLTSPPYPGVHVLYHRWQINGGKETPLPFLIANTLDGAGSSYYTMGDRKYPELATYFANITATMSSVAAVCSKDTMVMQILGFSEADWQLPRYLQAMEEAGLAEVFLPTL
jgi:hypothetical protein